MSTDYIDMLVIMTIRNVIMLNDTWMLLSWLFFVIKSAVISLAVTKFAASKSVVVSRFHFGLQFTKKSLFIQELCIEADSDVGWLSVLRGSWLDFFLDNPNSNEIFVINC